MTTCTLVAGVILCVISGPKMTPAEAAALLAPRQYVHVPRTFGPTVTIAQSDPRDGPFGPLTISAPIVRLDGTSYFDPPWLHVGYGDRYPYRDVRRSGGRMGGADGPRLAPGRRRGAR